MEPEGFNGVAGTVAMPSGKAYYVFTPKELPVPINDGKLVNLLADASAEIGRLDGMSQHLPNPYLFLKPNLMREAVLSSKIEGTRSSLSDVLMYEAREDGVPPSSDLQEVLNYIDALELGLKKVKTQEVDMALVLEMHKVLMKEVRGGDKNPGKIRNIQNWIGLPGSSVNNAPFVPPTPENVELLIQNLLSYMQKNGRLHPLLAVGLAHYQFESIHPFRDGNGRIGRLLIMLYLVKNGLLSAPFLYMSAFFEKNGREYRDLLLHVSKTGEYERWLEFFLAGTVEQAKETQTRVKMVVDYTESCRKKISKAGNANSLLLLDSLMENPYITISNAEKILEKTFMTANTAVELLEKLGVVKEITGQKRNRVYFAEEIFKRINDPLEKTATQ